MVSRNRVFVLGDDALRINVEVVRNKPTIGVTFFFECRKML